MNKKQLAVMMTLLAIPTTTTFYLHGEANATSEQLNKVQHTLNQKEDDYKKLEKDMTVALQDLKEKETEAQTLQEKHTTLSQTLSEAQKKLKETEDALAKEKERPRTVTTTATAASSTTTKAAASAGTTFHASAYSTYEHGDPYAGKQWGNKTASGTTVKQGRTVAVDRKVIPLGTKLRLIFPAGWEHLNGIYVAEDTGSAIKGNKIDVYMDSYQQCLQFGRRTITVEVLG